jgi:hypothetical protein
VIDIRQTKCTELGVSLFRRHWGCKGATLQALLFDPTPPLEVVSNLVALLHGCRKETTPEPEFAFLLINRLDHPESDPTNPSRAGPFDTACADPATLVLTDKSVIHGTVTEAREDVAFRVERPKLLSLTTMSGMPLGRRLTRVWPRLPDQDLVFQRHLVALPPAGNDFLLRRIPPRAHLTLEKKQFRAENGPTLRPNSEECRTEKRKRANDEILCIAKKVKPSPHDLFPLRMVGIESLPSGGISNTNPFAARRFS